MISTKDSRRGSHSTVGDKIENRERRRDEREKLDIFSIFALILGKFLVKNGEKLCFI